MCRHKDGKRRAKPRPPQLCAQAASMHLLAVACKWEVMQRWQGRDRYAARAAKPMVCKLYTTSEGAAHMHSSKEVLWHRLECAP